MTDLERIDEELRSRELFRRVLGTPDGLAVLALIRRECGVESMNPGEVKPDLVALCNWIHNMAGIYTPLNMFNVTKALVEAANDDDLWARRRAILAEGGGDA